MRAMADRFAVDLLNEAQVEHQRVQGWAYSQTHDYGIVCACGWVTTHDNANVSAAIRRVEADYREHLSCALLVALGWGTGKGGSVTKQSVMIVLDGENT